MPDVDLELIDLRVLSNDGFYRTRIHVCAANKLHIIPTSTNAAAIEIPCTPTGARTGRYLHHHILRAIAYQRNKPSSKRSHNPLPKFAIGYRLLSSWINYLLDKVILNDMRPA